MTTTQHTYDSVIKNQPEWPNLNIPTYIRDFRSPYISKRYENPFHFSDIPEGYSVFAYDIVGSRKLNFTDYNQIGAWPVGKFKEQYPNCPLIYSHQGDGGIIAIPRENEEFFLNSIKQCPYTVKVRKLNPGGIQIGTAEYRGVESTFLIGLSLPEQLYNMKLSGSRGGGRNQLPHQTNIDEQNIVQYSPPINIEQDLACIFFQLNNISSTEEIKQLLEIIDTVFNKYPYQIHALTVEGNIVKITASSFEPWSRDGVRDALKVDVKGSDKIEVNAFYPYAGQTLTIATYPDGSQQIMPADPNGSNRNAYLEAAARAN